MLAIAGTLSESNRVSHTQHILELKASNCYRPSSSGSISTVGISTPQTCLSFHCGIVAWSVIGC